MKAFLGGARALEAKKRLRCVSGHFGPPAGRVEHAHVSSFACLVLVLPTEGDHVGRGSRLAFFDPLILRLHPLHVATRHMTFGSEIIGYRITW